MQLRDLLLQLFEETIGVRPVEANLRGREPSLPASSIAGMVRGISSSMESCVGARSLLLRSLDLLPVAQHGIGVGGLDSVQRCADAAE